MISYLLSNLPAYAGTGEYCMDYFVSKKVAVAFDEAVAKARAVLKEEGFGVLTEIDVAATLKRKLGVDFRPYRILGACHPESAYAALQAEDKIGLMLPCNVVVQEFGDGGVEVSAIDPVASMAAVENEGLADVAANVRQKLKNVIERL
jgi:uncharacterized protein (DUF302 family)